MAMRPPAFRSRFAAAALAATAGFLAPAPAAAQIVVTADLEEVCTQPPVSHRRTVAYIDLTAVDPDELEWGLTILNRLELAPREWLTVLAVNAIDYSIKEVFSLCYPALTDEEIEALRADRSFWDDLTTFDPEQQQEENLEMFDSRLRLAMDSVREQAIALDRSAPRRNIIGALAFDKNRFADKQFHTRAVIFTDGRIVEEGIDPGRQAAGAAAALTAKYPANFGGADISMFGVTAAGEGAPDAEAMRGVFEDYFLANWGLLRSFSFALPEQAGTPFRAPERYIGKFDGGGVSGEAVLGFTLDAEGRLTAGWLTFATGKGPLNVPLEGDLRCADDACSLTAHVTHDVPPATDDPFFKEGDRVVLKGNPEVLKGTLEAAVPETFEGVGETVVYSIALGR